MNQSFDMYGKMAETTAENVTNNPTASVTVVADQPIPAILDGKFFEIISVNKNNKGNNVVAKCKSCVGRKRNYKGSLEATTNFTSHLQVSLVTLINNIIINSIFINILLLPCLMPACQYSIILTLYVCVI